MSDEKQSVAETEKPVISKSAKAKPIAPNPAALVAKVSAPAVVPVVTEFSEDDLVAAEKYGEVADEKVFLIKGTEKIEIGAATHENPLRPYAKAYLEHLATVARFQARLKVADLTIKDVQEGIKSLQAPLDKPDFVGDYANLATVTETTTAAAKERLATMQAEREAAKAAALKTRQALVEEAETIAAKAENKIHWKNDTNRLRDLLEEWKTAQRNGARIPKDEERELWKRFTTARSGFEKLRRQHFQQLDKDNAAVASAKEELVKKAEALADITDWDKGARRFKELMTAWRGAGRGRRATDDALWERFQAAQTRFFDARHAAAAAEESVLAQNVPAKEAIVVEAEALLPIKDIDIAKSRLRSLQDRYDAAGEVPRADFARLNKRIGAVEKAVREAEESVWEKKNPELEARASGAASQLQASIDALEAEIATAKAGKNQKKVKELEEALAARKSWLEQILNVVN